MKNHQIIHRIFQSFGIIFVCVSGYELLQLITPYYSYTRFLIVSVFIALLYLLYNKKISRENMRNFWNAEWIQKIISQHPDAFGVKSFTYFERNKENIIYGGFIGVFMVSILAIIWGYQQIFSFVAITYIIIYIFAKIAWFRMQRQIQKYTFHDTNALRFFLLVFVVCIICVWTLLSESFVPEGGRWKYYFVVWVLYCIGMVWIFFKISLPKKRFSVYNILSLLVISSLFGGLIYKNFIHTENSLWEDAVERLQSLSHDPEPNDIPVIISQEAQILPETDHSSVKVSEKYNISPWLLVGSSGKNVSDLQEVLLLLWAKNIEVTWNYDENTRRGLRNILMEQCDWPESTKWSFGPLAKQCIDNLEIFTSQTER